MTAFIEGPAVTVVEVAKRAGLTVDDVQTEAAALSLFVGLNWAHEAALSTRDAFALMDRFSRRRDEHETARQAHAVALEQWQVTREDVQRRAFVDAWAAATRKGRPNAPATMEAHAASREALAEFEKANPKPVEPVFSQPVKAGAP